MPIVAKGWIDIWRWAFVLNYYGKLWCHLVYHLSSFFYGFEAGAVVAGTAFLAGGVVGVVGCAAACYLSFFSRNRLKASSTISSVSPFLRRKMRFWVSDTFSRSFPLRKMEAMEMSFSLYYNFFKSYSYFCFFFASLLPIYLIISMPPSAHS